MAAFNYRPTELKLPELPRLGQNIQSQLPRTQINNTFARSILDTLGRNIQPVTAFTQNNRIEDALAPTRALGQQFIQQALLPDFQQNVYNPFRQQLASRAAGSNLGLMGNARNFVSARTREVTQPFIDQTQQVTDRFDQLGYQNVNDLLKAFYGSQLNF